MFKELKKNKELTIVFSANFKNIDISCAKIKLFLSELGLKKYEFQTLTALREALCNAVLHGSHNDPSKKVSLEMRFNKPCLILEIEDQGDGFDWKNQQRAIPDPRVEGGRGLAIMRHHFGDIKFNKKGNKLILNMDIRE